MLVIRFFLGTHYTDNLKHASHFNYFWDYINVVHATRVQMGTQVFLTTLLIMCFYLSLSDYYTFAISFTSGLSKYGENIMFTINDAKVINLYICYSYM